MAYIQRTSPYHDEVYEYLYRPFAFSVKEPRLKFLAEMALVRDRRIVIPTREEWVGLNMLERDSEI